MAEDSWAAACRLTNGSVGRLEPGEHYLSSNQRELCGGELQKGICRVNVIGGVVGSHR